jgi:hypothetical protein
VGFRAGSARRGEEKILGSTGTLTPTPLSSYPVTIRTALPGPLHYRRTCQKEESPFDVATVKLVRKGTAPEWKCFFVGSDAEPENMECHLM